MVIAQSMGVQMYLRVKCSFINKALDYSMSNTIIKSFLFAQEKVCHVFYIIRID